MKLPKGLIIFITLMSWLITLSKPIASQADTTNQQVGLMLDCARIYNDPATIEKYIDLLAQNHGTYLQLHLTDNENFGVESQTLAQTPTQNSYQVGDTYYNRFTHRPYLTKQQLQSIIAYGQQKHIAVIPEIDVPGHSKALIQQLKRIDAKQAKAFVNPYSKTDELNYHQMKVIDWIKQLLNEYVELVPVNNYIATGGDEDTVTDTADKKAIVKFENELNQFVNQHNRVMQIWNDNVHKQNLAQFDKNIRILYWSQSGETNQTRTNQNNLKSRATLPQINHTGLKSINANAYYLYILANRNKLDNLGAKSIVTELKAFHPAMWNGTKHNLINPHFNNNEGAMLSMWGNQNQINGSNLYPKMVSVWQAFSQQMN